MNTADRKNDTALINTVARKNHLGEAAKSKPMTPAANPRPMRGITFWVLMLKVFARITMSGGTIAGMAALLAGMKKERTVDKVNAVTNNSQTGGWACRKSTAAIMQSVS